MKIFPVSMGPQTVYTWAARAKYKGRLYNLGTYDTPEEAAQVSHEWRLINLPGYAG